MDRRISIGVDMDGVLADLLTSVLDAYNKDYGDTLVASDILSWDVSQYVKSEAKSSFNDYYIQDYSDVDAIPGSVDVLKYLNRHFEVWVVTDPYSVELYEPKLTWLLETYSFLDMRDIVMTGDKGVVGCDYLIDDNLDNLIRYRECNPTGVGLLYDAPYNKDLELPFGVFRVYSWESILDYFIEYI